MEGISGVSELPGAGQSRGGSGSSVGRRSSVFELVRSLGQSGKRPSESARDTVGNVPRGVRGPAFDAPDGSLIHVRGVGKRFLAEPSLTATQADRAAEGGLWCWAWAHAGRLGADSPNEQELCFRL